MIITNRICKPDHRSALSPDGNQLKRSENIIIIFNPHFFHALYAYPKQICPYKLRNSDLMFSKM